MTKIDYELMERAGAPLLEELVAYWERQRGRAAMPPRRAIDPGALQRHLPNLFMLDVLDGGADFRFRLIGTRIVEGLGRDSTGKRFSELFAQQPEVRARLQARFCRVVTDKCPSFSRGSMFWHQDRRYRRFVAASVPLSPDGVTVNIILSELLIETSSRVAENP
jgi:hypothetical protein